MGELLSLANGQVLSRIRALVAAGEYRDELYGVPGTCLSGGGQFMNRPDGRQQRVYQRGTAEYLDAKAAGLTERLPPLEKASAGVLSEAERILGRPLPALLRRLYSEVGNGGFGPGYGVLGVFGGHRDDAGHDAISLHQSWELPRPFLLPICHWGCGIYSFIDLSTPAGAMWAYDPNPVPHDQLDNALVPQQKTFATWLEQWTIGHLYQPAVIQDPDGTWRAASDDEMQHLLSD